MNLSFAELAPRVRIVLVETLYSGNIGSVCRSMANMGLSDLALVSPQAVDGWEEAARLACHATDILETRREFPTLADAIADCTMVAGATARLGLYRQHVRPPREIAPEVWKTAAAGGRVAMVFGREDKGLLNDEIVQCTHLVRIPASADYLSLNLSQAVMVCTYELFMARGDYEQPREKSLPATAAQRAQMMAMWRRLLLLTGFMEEDKADHMMQGFQRIFTRGAVTDDDLRILMGVARQAEWAARADPSMLPGAASPGLPGGRRT
ncbi:MAG: RNA methyltransferase [Kiritimatiellia bacterium]|jgi:tRNA/rRNA methyltransferase